MRNAQKAKRQTWDPENLRLIRRNNTKGNTIHVLWDDIFGYFTIRCGRAELNKNMASCLTA